jgi:hypothetical protein
VQPNYKTGCTSRHAFRDEGLRALAPGVARLGSVGVFPRAKTSGIDLLARANPPLTEVSAPPHGAVGKELEMEKWIVIGGIWILVSASLVMFVRGASPARNRVQMARLREKRLKGPKGQVKAQEAGTARDQ